MNIDYSEIITKANARKEALQALSKALEPAEHHAADLFDALDYFATLLPLAKAIDAEGKAMMPRLLERVNDIAYRCESLRSALICGSDQYRSMPGLLAALRGPAA